MKFLEYHDTARNQHAADFLRHSRRQQAVDIGADLGTDMVAQQRYLQSHGESPLDVRRTAISIFCARQRAHFRRSEEHTSELQSLMRISYAVFCLKKKINNLYQ